MDVILILYLVLLVAISSNAGVRSGKEPESLRSTAAQLALKTAAAVGMVSACLTIILYLYAYYVISSGSVTIEPPAPLIPVLGWAVLLGLETGASGGVLAGLTAMTAQRITIWRMGDRVRSGHCSGCGYDVTGNESGICPECGSRLGVRPLDAT